MEEGTQTRHLSDEELTVALADGDEAQPHLANCATCFEETQRLRRALAGYAAASRENAERPESAWAEQRRIIAERVEKHSWAIRRLVWAAAAASLALTAQLVLQQAPPVRPNVQVDPDHLLLFEVNLAVDRTLPRAFEPARLLTQEMVRAAQAQSNSDSTKQGEKK